MNAFVWGVGTSRFGRQPDKSGAQLVWEAVTEAVADAGTRSFDAIYVGSCFGEPGVAPLNALKVVGAVTVMASLSGVRL